MSKKIIISGCTGQDGSYMCEYLLENTEYEILGGIRRTSQAILKNLKKCLTNTRFKLVPLELTDIHSITTLIKNEKPDYFIHFGASSFVADSWNQPAMTLSVNSVSLIHILEAIKEFAPDCRFYSAGSSEQWGDVKYSPQDEKHPMSPRSIYGVSKCAASHICKVYRESYGIYAVHGLLLNHESPRRQSYFISKKITEGVARIYHSIKNNQDFKPIICGNITAQRDWSHSKDFIDGVWKMLNQEKYNTVQFNGIEHNDTKKLAQKIKEYVLSSNQTQTVKHLIELAFSKANIMGKWVGSGLNEKFILNNTKILVEISPEFFRPADVELLLGDSTLIKQELGWEPKYSFDELIDEMVKSDIENYSDIS